MSALKKLGAGFLGIYLGVYMGFGGFMAALGVTIVLGIIQAVLKTNLWLAHPVPVCLALGVAAIGLPLYGIFRIFLEVREMKSRSAMVPAGLVSCLLASFGIAAGIAELQYLQQDDVFRSKYDPIKKELENSLRIGLHVTPLDRLAGKVGLGNNGFDPDKSRILLTVQNASSYRIKSFSLRFSLYSNGQKVYQTSMIGIGDPKWETDLENEAVFAVDVDRSSDDYYRLKTAGELELRFERCSVHRAIIDGKDVDLVLEKEK